MFEITYQIKPLSINEAFRGRRFKSPAYTNYEAELLYALPAKKLPAAPYSVYMEFGFSNKASDLDNPCKILIDVMQKKYGFNDKEVYEIKLKKVIVPKGREYFKIKMETVA